MLLVLRGLGAVEILMFAAIAGAAAPDHGEEEREEKCEEEKTLHRSVPEKTQGRPQTAGPGHCSAKNYFLEPAVVGLPLPQPTTDTTLRARTKATRTRFIRVLQKV